MYDIRLDVKFSPLEASYIIWFIRSLSRPCIPALLSFKDMVEIKLAKNKHKTTRVSYTPYATGTNIKLLVMSL